jgi:hypothetical protein
VYGHSGPIRRIDYHHLSKERKVITTFYSSGGAGVAFLKQKPRIANTNWRDAQVVKGPSCGLGRGVSVIA